jgi:hypothetical protein
MKFPDLRRDIENISDLQIPNPQNYDTSSDDRMAKLVDNLANTEIDVVLQTPESLLIGEAKHEARFGANGSYVLCGRPMKVCGFGPGPVPLGPPFERRRRTGMSPDYGAVQQKVFHVRVVSCK